MEGGEIPFVTVLASFMPKPLRSGQNFNHGHASRARSTKRFKNPINHSKLCPIRFEIEETFRHWSTVSRRPLTTVPSDRFDRLLPCRRHFYPVVHRGRPTPFTRYRAASHPNYTVRNTPDLYRPLVTVPFSIQHLPSVRYSSKRLMFTI